MMCVCVYFITGAPEGSTESGSGQARNRTPATHGLQGIGLIHYTTAVSLKKLFVAFSWAVTSTGLGWFMGCACIL